MKLIKLKNNRFISKLSVCGMYAILESNCYNYSDLKMLRNKLYNDIGFETKTILLFDENSAEYIAEKAHLIREYRYLSKDSNKMFDLTENTIDKETILNMSTTKLVCLKFAMKKKEIFVDTFDRADILKYLQIELNIRINIRILVDLHMHKMSSKSDTPSYFGEFGQHKFDFSIINLDNISFVNSLPVQELYSIYISDIQKKFKRLTTVKLFSIIEYSFESVDELSIGYEFANNEIHKHIKLNQLSDEFLLELYTTSTFIGCGINTIFSLEQLIKNNPELKEKVSYQLLTDAIREHISVYMKYKEYINIKNDPNTIKGDLENDNKIKESKQKNCTFMRKDSLDSNASSVDVFQENTVEIDIFKKLLAFNGYKINKKYNTIPKSIKNDYGITKYNKDFNIFNKQFRKYIETEINLHIKNEISSHILKHYNNCTIELLSSIDLIKLQGYIKSSPTNDKMQNAKEINVPPCKMNLRIPKLVKIHLLTKYVSQFNV